MEVKAHLNGLRVAPRKVRSVANLLKGKDVQVADDQLAVMVRRSVPALGKLIKSAIANAENNYHMVHENLFIKNIMVDEGVKFKRFIPKGFGRAAPIEKKSSRITVILDERVAGLKRTPKERAQVKAEQSQEKGAVQSKPSVRKPDITKQEPKRRGIMSLGRRLFQRKTI